MNFLGIGYTQNHIVGSTSAHVVCGNNCSIQICTLIAHLLFEKLSSYLVGSVLYEYSRIVMLKIQVNITGLNILLTK